MSGLAIDGNIVHGLAIKGQAFQPVTISDGEIKVGDKTYDLDTTQYFVPTKDNFYEVSQLSYSYGSHITLNKGQKYEILRDYTDEYGTRHLVIYDPETLDVEHGNLIGDILGVQGTDINDNKIVGGGVISPLTHIWLALRSLLKEVITWD